MRRKSSHIKGTNLGVESARLLGGWPWVAVDRRRLAPNLDDMSKREFEN